MTSEEFIEQLKSVNYNGSLLPDNLIVNRNLHLSGLSLTSLPNNLIVNGYLYLSGLSLTSLPNNLIVNGDLHLIHSSILNNLPDNLIVNRDLDLSYCLSLTNLPDNLIVNGIIRLDGCANLEKTFYKKYYNIGVNSIELTIDKKRKMIYGGSFNGSINEFKKYNNDLLIMDEIEEFLT